MHYMLLFLFMFIYVYVNVLYNFDNCFASREDLVLYVCTKFCGCCLSGFGDCAHFCLPSKQPKFPFGPWTIVHGHQNI